MNYTILCAFLVGFFLGAVFGAWRMFHYIFHKKNGTLLIDQRDPDMDHYNLAFDTDLDSIPKCRFVIFKVQVIKSRKNLPL